jgi:NAD(P)-dependent dehydrogenase (short-subunit alcohol dehydrogenase family)
MFKDPTPAHRNLIPVGRFGQPEEIAQVVELLITNSYMTDKVWGTVLSTFSLGVTPYMIYKLG